MATVLEDVGKKTIEHLDYVGSLNIQLWSTLRAMKKALPLVGNCYRWHATVHQMLQIGYDALPMVSLMALCRDSFSRCREPLNCGALAPCTT